MRNSVHLHTTIPCLKILRVLIHTAFLAQLWLTLLQNSQWYCVTHCSKYCSTNQMVGGYTNKQATYL